jgi:myo-inositol-1(or 4)-monophosphatase
MNLETITFNVIDIVKEVGNFIYTERKTFSYTAVEQKGHTSNLVSYVDKEAENRLVTLLKKLLPESGFVTEESTIKQRSTEEYYWVIDPLDGTTNFIHNLPIYSVSVALMRHDAVVSGVVYDITRDECFYAWQGSGAWLNGKKIQTSAVNDLSHSLIATGFPYYEFEKMDAYIAVVRDLMRQTQGLRRCGSAAIDMVYVAAGRFDSYFEYNINAWDIAAGAIIVQEAGGIVSNFKGEENCIFQRNIVASAPGLHTQMLNLIAKNWI